MGKFIVRRAAGLLPLLVGVVFISFVLMRLAPGGPQAALAGIKSLTEADRDAWLRRWCLQDEVTPGKIAIEFGGWFGILNCNHEGLEAFVSDRGGLNVLPAFLGGGDNGIIHGDLGRGIKAGRPVTALILERIPATLILTLTAFVLWVGIAILAGTYAAVHRYSLFDQVLTLVTYILYSLPVFWLGLMLIFTFGVAIQILPTGGIVTAREWPPFNTEGYWAAFGRKPVEGILDVAGHLVLPVTTLVSISVAGDSRFVRASMLEALGQDFVRTARAKGLPGRRVVGKHAFRNAMLPVVTNIALEIPVLFSGAIVTETIFTWPGMGRLFITAINDRDYFVLMGLLLVTSIIVLLANLLADVIYALVDPRVRYD